METFKLVIQSIIDFFSTFITDAQMDWKNGEIAMAIIGYVFFGFLVIAVLAIIIGIIYFLFWILDTVWTKKITINTKVTDVQTDSLPHGGYNVYYDIVYFEIENKEYSIDFDIDDEDDEENHYADHPYKVGDPIEVIYRVGRFSKRKYII